MYFKTIKYYVRPENGSINYITKHTEYINLNKTHYFKSNDNEEMKFKYDSAGKCISFVKISEIMGNSDTLTTNLIYKNGLLIEVKQENKITYSWGLKSAKYYYNKNNQMIKMIVSGNPEEITYKFFYDKNDFIIKREMYFENRPAGYNEYIYVKSEN